MIKKFIFAVLFLSFSSFAFALELPDKIQNWRSVSEYVTPLTAGENNFGRVVYKNYERKKTKGILQVIMTEGKGTGELYVPSSVKNSKGVMPLNSDYEILNVSGFNAVLETQENLPLSLALNCPDNVVITIETYSLNRNEIVKFAEELLSKISQP